MISTNKNVYMMPHKKNQYVIGFQSYPLYKYVWDRVGPSPIYRVIRSEYDSITMDLTAGILLYHNIHIDTGATIVFDKYKMLNGMEEGFNGSTEHARLMAQLRAKRPATMLELDELLAAPITSYMGVLMPYQITDETTHTIEMMANVIDKNNII